MKALVCTLSGIGNTLTALPLITALKSLGYEVHVRLSESRGTRSLFTDNPHVSKTYGEGGVPNDFDIACCTHLCTAFHQGCSFAKKTYMIEPGRVANFEAKSIHRYEKHEIEYCMDLARDLGYTGKVPRVLVPNVVSAFEIVEEKTVVLGVGYWKKDDFSHKKHWGNENFAAFADLLLTRGFTPLFIGDSGDRANLDAIKGMIKQPGALEMVDYPLPEVFYTLGRCLGYVGNETMLVPAAAGMGIPCISLVFHEALHNPRKTYPYPGGLALVGKRVEFKPEVVFSYFDRQQKEGQWTMIQPIGQEMGIARRMADSRLHCVKKGFGGKGPKVSIVILVCDFDDVNLLCVASTCIRKVRQTAPTDAEIIIVANAPSKALRELIRGVENEDRRVVSIAMNQNLGVVAKNFAYNLAQGEFICSIDSDVAVQPGWVEKFIGFMESHPDCGLVGPCGGRLRVEHWAADQWACSNYPEGPRSFFGYEDCGYFGRQTESGVDGTVLDAIPSMCWCFRRKCLDEVGYLDWRFGPFVGSDADFCLRLKKAGWDVQIVRVPIEHAVGGGSAHKNLLDLQDLKVDHTKALFDRWYPHRAVVCEYGKGG